MNKVSEGGLACHFGDFFSCKELSNFRQSSNLLEQGSGSTGDVAYILIAGPLV